MTEIEVEALKAPLTQPAGYFLLKPGDPKRDVTEKMLRLSNVAGLTIRVPWSEVNPREREFTWREVDENLALCDKVGKPAKLLIQTGRDGLSPTWLGGQWIGSAGKTSPAPWSPQMADAYHSLCQAAGTRYRQHKRLVAFHVTGPTWPSAEMHPMPGLKHQRGYTLVAMREAWRDALISANDGFPSISLCLSISVMHEANSYVRDVITAGLAIAGTRLCLQHNALQADTPLNAPHHVLIREQWQKGFKVGFEMACSAMDDPGRFGSGDVMDGVEKGRVIGGSYFDIYPRPGDVAALR